MCLKVIQINENTAQEVLTDHLGGAKGLSQQRALTTLVYILQLNNVLGHSFWPNVWAKISELRCRRNWSARLLRQRPQTRIWYGYWCIYMGAEDVWNVRVSMSLGMGGMVGNCSRSWETELMPPRMRLMQPQAWDDRGQSEIFLKVGT